MSKPSAKTLHDNFLYAMRTAMLEVDKLPWTDREKDFYGCTETQYRLDSLAFQFLCMLDGNSSTFPHSLSLMNTDEKGKPVGPEVHGDGYLHDEWWDGFSPYFRRKKDDS